MLWSRTRDAAWMLIVFGIIFAYIEIVYSILGLFFFGGDFYPIGSVSLLAFILPSLRMLTFIAAFVIMIIRQK
jgi:membrane protein implicated in regulation of membrane protease activity